MVDKDLTEIIEACDNMPHYYEDYLALGRNICANLSFGDYIYFKYGFWTKHDYDHSFNISNPYREEPSFSTSLRKEEEEEGTKGEDSSNPSACSRFKSLFGFSSNKDSKYCDMSTNKYEKFSSFLEENRNEVEAYIHEVECKSLEGDYVEEEKEGECTSKIFGGDLQISNKDVGSCMGEETYFVSNPK